MHMITRWQQRVTKTPPILIQISIEYFAPSTALESLHPPIEPAAYHIKESNGGFRMDISNNWDSSRQRGSAISRFLSLPFSFFPSSLIWIESTSISLSSLCLPVHWLLGGEDRDPVTTFISWNVWCGSTHSGVFYPCIRLSRELRFQALSLSCHQTNESLRAEGRDSYLLFVTPLSRWLLGRGGGSR